MSSGRQMLALGHQTPSGVQSGASSVLFSGDLPSGSLLFAGPPVRRGRHHRTCFTGKPYPTCPCGHHSVLLEAGDQSSGQEISRQDNAQRLPKPLQLPPPGQGPTCSSHGSEHLQPQLGRPAELLGSKLGSGEEGFTARAQAREHQHLGKWKGTRRSHGVGFMRAPHALLGRKSGPHKHL